MTEISRFWDGHITGDASVAPYDAATEFSRVLASLAGGGSGNMGGVFPGEGSELEVTGTGTPLSVAAGAALVYGTWYQNSAAYSLACPIPAGLREDLVVLEKDWDAQTVRIKLQQGVDGGAAATLQQTGPGTGTVWQIPLARAYNNAGTITVYQARQLLPLGAIVKLASISPSGSATIDFTKITEGYKHLRIVAALLCSHAANGFSLYFNGDNAAAKYSYTYTVLSTGAHTVTDYATQNYVNNNALTAGPEVVVIDIPNYTDITANRGFLFQHTAYTSQDIISGYWINTAAKINRITLALTDGGHTFTTGSLVTLYGLP